LWLNWRVSGVACMGYRRPGRTDCNRLIAAPKSRQMPAAPLSPQFLPPLRDSCPGRSAPPPRYPWCVMGHRSVCAWVTRSWALASSAMGHRDKCPLDFQLFNFSHHFRATQTLTWTLHGCLPRFNILTYSLFTVYCMNFIIFLSVTLELFSLSFVRLLAPNPGTSLSVTHCLLCYKHHLTHQESSSSRHP